MTLSKPGETVARPEGPRNTGIGLHEGWLEELDLSSGKLDSRAASIRDSLPTDPETEVDQLLSAVRSLDLTALSDDDTDESVRRLCTLACRPVEPGLLANLGRPDEPLSVAAVCVYDRFVPLAREALLDTGVRVAAVTAGFPLPHDELPRRTAEIRATVEAGADELDVVVTRRHALAGDWAALYEEVVALRDAAAGARLKVILAAGALGSLDTVARASLSCCMAGADFLKTSTGRETVNATLPIGLAMARAIKLYRERSGYAVGLKAAGGIRTAVDARRWIRVRDQELGNRWRSPRIFRLGASSVLAAIERRLRECAPAEPKGTPELTERDEGG